MDIIAKYARTYVFVEVKIRSSLAFGEPESFVGFKKRQMLFKAARSFLLNCGESCEIRFDIIAIYKFGSQVRLKHIEAAF